MLKRKFGSWPVLLVCFAMLAIGAGCDGEEGNEAPGGSGGGVAGSGGGGTGGEEPGQGGTGGEEPGQGGSGGDEPGQGGTGGEEPGQGGSGGEEPGQGGSGGEEPGQGGSGGEEPGQGGSGGEEPGQGGTGGEEPGQGGTGGNTVPTGPHGVTAAQCEQSCARVIEGCGSTRFGERFACESWCFDNLSAQEATCLTNSQCTGMEFEACVGTDATNDCDAMCEHVYGCGVNFDGQDITYCDGLCATGDFSNDEVNCILGSTCEMSQMQACMPEEGGPEGTCYDMCDNIYQCGYTVANDPTTQSCRNNCDNNVYEQDLIGCIVSGDSCMDTDVCVNWGGPQCASPTDNSPECLGCKDDMMLSCVWFDEDGLCEDEVFDFYLCYLFDSACPDLFCAIYDCTFEWAAVSSCARSSGQCSGHTDACQM